MTPAQIEELRTLIAEWRSAYREYHNPSKPGSATLRMAECDRADDAILDFIGVFADGLCDCAIAGSKLPKTADGVRVTPDDPVFHFCGEVLTLPWKEWYRHWIHVTDCYSTPEAAALAAQQEQP